MTHRSPAWLAAAALAVALSGLVLDKVFTDNTPPYDEPLISVVGLAGFLLGLLVFLVLGTVALVRELRARRAGRVPAQRLRLGVAAATLVLAATQISYWEDLSTANAIDVLLLLMSTASALALIVFAIGARRAPARSGIGRG